LLKTVRSRGYLGIIIIDLSRLSRIEREYGRSAYDVFLRDAAKIVVDMQGSVIRNDDEIYINASFGEQFVIALSQKRKGIQLRREDMELVGDRVYEYLLAPMMQLTRRYSTQSPSFDVGYSFAIRNPMLESERVVQRLLDEARDVARSQRYRFSIKNREKLKDLILSEQISTVFQPIINLKTGDILGYESLSRGPRGTIWENPAVLFSVALETDLAFEVDRLCRRLALERAKTIRSGWRVFVNTLPISLNDPEFRGQYLKEFLQQVRLAPKNIVLEMTETMAVEQFDVLRRALRYYRDLGFAVAIDDAGTGYANLEMIMHLKPEFIKIDLSLIRNIGRSILKRELVKALKSIAAGIDADLIAEGVEQKRELQTLRKLGITYGQGYLFARPGSPFPAPIVPS
jgi:EAL domain-containing protein (putative c-di-GMP-specific phosphodiesterase class I)